MGAAFAKLTCYLSRFFQTSGKFYFQLRSVNSHPTGPLGGLHRMRKPNPLVGLHFNPMITVRNAALKDAALLPKCATLRRLRFRRTQVRASVGYGFRTASLRLLQA